MHVSLLELLFRFGRHRLLFLLLRRKDMDQKIRSIEQLPGCDVAGPRDAFPIVLVHGSASTRNMWVPQMETFSDEFLVIAVDLPGHGALREQPFRLEAAIQAVMESLRHQSHDRALIVGLSLGGYIAMACAHEHPQEIAGLVLSGCCIDYRGALGFLSRLDSSFVTTLFSEDQLSRMQAKALRSRFPEALVEPLLKAGFSWKVAPHVYRELASHDFSAMLRSFPGSVLIVNGENDKPNRKREAVLLRATQDGQLQIIKQAGHLCNLEQPEAFTFQVRTFAKRLSEETRRGAFV
jgi:pimeloyl-ACP methyl ester carboxylesterase